jgi:hypothetical protein
MKRRKQGDTQETASAKAGISERRGRDIEHSQRIDPGSKEHDWRTRSDPLVSVWGLEPEGSSPHNMFHASSSHAVR